MLTTVMSSKGQVVIPKQVRDTLGLEPGDRLSLEVEGNTLVISRYPEESAPSHDWRKWEGVLAGTNVLADLLAEHRRELEREGLL